MPRRCVKRFAALMIRKVMIPVLLKGRDPIAAGLLAVGALTAAVSCLVGGLRRKGLVTFVGAFSGLLLARLLVTIFTKQFRLHGAVRPFAETLNTIVDSFGLVTVAPFTAIASGLIYQLGRSNPIAASDKVLLASEPERHTLGQEQCS